MNDNSRKDDATDIIKLNSNDLRVGMFVCDLDRPWLETPFLMQGFHLKTMADIEVVQKYCQHVYVDMLRTRVPEQKTGLRALFSGGPDGSFNKEIQKAESSRQQTSDLVKSFIDDIRFGRSVDIQLAKSAVSECVGSILRNPDAMVFMTQMREKDASTSQHALNVCIYSIILGRLAGLRAKELENIGTCGLVHDLGKVAIPIYILNKKGKLTNEEMAIMRQHTTHGRDILMSGRYIYSGTVDVAYNHHENLDGSGYPRGLMGAQLNLNSKVAAIVDKYDAITNLRPYRPARDHLYAVNVLNKLVKHNQLDATLTAGFISYLGVYPPGSIIEMSTGEIAIVLESNPGQRLRPQIMVVRDAEQNPAAHFVDLVEKTTDDRGQPYKIKAVRNADDLKLDLRKYKDAILQSLG